jgi:CRP-like cAMP-binding protein
MLFARGQKGMVMNNHEKQGSVKNRILAGLSSKDLRRVEPNLERVVLRASDTAFEPGEPIRHVYFPEDALISLVASLEDGRGSEVCLSGPEGLVGISAALGLRTYLYRPLVQVPGACLRMEVERFVAEFRRGGLLHDRVLRYLGYLLNHVSQISVCNRLHLVKQRLARRLLMIQDRVRQDQFTITHEFSAYMLGTPRSEVSIAADALRKSGIIQYSRGRVRILRRKDLEAAACECYGVIHHEFLRLT